ncbi:thiamine-phosphate kinase [Denitrobaculum tricleocarpae]|uniref:Thiamine-monophosphate kinase n=1 Tax=Denitrobaculum tricleocarpae TaxID=2591009 RepID=A0A545TTE0_9PROT|nr:thiamine-phosphate kinase [Denitrobaculum tricleocarpae]TQV80483.1 thiamine-phosphate kinase [Denitrobaculum tricleocarpae]
MSGEFDLIARYFAPLAAEAPGTFGLRNDAALLPSLPGSSIVVTADSLASGVHFRPNDPPELVAKKSLRVNLSDLAAMGAKPLGYLLNLALPKGGNEAWVRGFSAGLAEDQAEFGVSLYGGDTVATDGPLLITVTAFGATPEGTALDRGTAQAGDLIYVSGSLGDAALGLAVFNALLPELDEVAAEYLRDRYLLPRPRVALGQRLLREGLASAAMDVSDGLVADLGHIAKASGLGAELRAANLPLSAAAAGVMELRPDLSASILGGGDDYELLFNLAPERTEEIARLALELDLPLTCIGKMLPGEGVRVLAPDGEVIEVDKPGWNHLA